MASTLTVREAELLAESWQLALRAERKSAQTLKAYGDGVRQFLAWCADREAPPMARASLSLWVAELLDAGAAAATARARQLAVRPFAAWPADEEEITADPFLGVESPKLDERVIEPLTDDQLRALLKACTPPAGVEPKVALRHRRDEALIRLMFETGLRAGETVELELADLDLLAGTAVVRRGKGGKGRVVPIGRTPSARSTATSGCDVATDSPTVSRCGSATGESGSPTTRCTRRSPSAPPPLGSRTSIPTGSGTPQHTGGSPPAAPSPGLMAVAGRTRPDMLMRYIKAQASARAAEEARKLKV